MKKKVFAVLTAASLTGCVSGNNTSVQTEKQEKTIISSEVFSEEDNVYDGVTYNYSDGTPMLSFDKRYESISEKHPDKTILIWATDQDIRYEDEVNEYLCEHGKDYVICFNDILFGNAMFNPDGTYNSYTTRLESDLSAGACYDIIDSGGILLEKDGFNSTYRHCVQKGYLAELDDSLKSTQLGKKLYDLMPQKYWDTLKINGRIYGVDGMLTSLKDETGFLINSYITDNDKIKPEDLVKATYNDTVAALVDYCNGKGYGLDIGTLGSPRTYSDFDYLTECVYYENGQAKNYFETKQAAELFDLLFEAYKNGNYYKLTDEKDFTKCLAESKVRLCGRRLYNGVLTNEENGIQGVIAAYQYYPEYQNKLYPAARAVGVYSGSENKDQAFDAIATVYGEKELNDIICFGTEFKKQRDGTVFTEGHYNTVAVENRLIRSPFKDVNTPESGVLLRKAYDEYDKSILFDIDIDLSSCEGEIAATNKILAMMPFNFPTDSYKSGSEYLEHLNEQLYDAGLQKILSTVNGE